MFVGNNLKSSEIKSLDHHCVKIVHVWSFSDPYFAAFELNTKRYSVSLRTEKIRIRKILTLHKKMKFSITDFFSKCDQICKKLRKKSLIENFHFLCSVKYFYKSKKIRLFDCNLYIF